MNAAEVGTHEVQLSKPSNYEWVYVQIAPVPNVKDLVHVFLSARLDKRYEFEAKALELFGSAGDRIDLDYRVKINLDTAAAELSGAIRGLYKKDSTTATYLGADPIELVPNEEMRAMCSPIAEIGRSVFSRLFGVTRHFEGHQPADDNLLSDVVRSIMGRRNALFIKSPMRLFPWTFLYDDPSFEPDNHLTLDPKRFWGFKHLIEEEIDGIAKRLPIRRPAKLLAAVCQQTDRDNEHAKGPLGELAQQYQITVDWLHSVDDLRKALANFDADCLYFYGHAHQNIQPTQTSSYIKLDGEKLTADQIAQKGIQFNKCPVVIFLNGCETSSLNTWDSESIAGLLWSQGQQRICCIATTAPVPIAFGRAFGNAFLAKFLRGATLGDALRDARIELFDNYSNPLGLLYTLLGKAETRFV